MTKNPQNLTVKAAIKFICLFSAFILFQIFIHQQRGIRAAYPLLKLDEKMERHYWKRVQEQEASKKAQLQKESSSISPS